jgi:hypothetical protein
MFAAFVLVVAALVAQATEKPKPVALPCSWERGARFSMDLTKSKERWQDGKILSNQATLTPIDFEVADKTKDGYVFRWTLHKSAVVAGETNPMTEPMAEIMDGIAIDFATDAQGTVVSIVAPEKLESEAAKRIDLLAKTLAKQGMNADEVASFCRVLGPNFRGPSWRALLMNEPQIFTMPSGAALVLGEKRAYESLLPNPFGGAMLPANAYLQLRAVDADRHEAIVEWRQTVDSDKASPILEASVREAAKRTGQALPAEAALTFDTIEDATTYVYDLKTGWPKSVVWSRSSTMAGVRTIDGLRFEVRPAAAK